MTTLPQLIAHRGASQLAPENTLSAFAQAKALGATWLEFDVQLSADHHAVIIHDDTLERTTNGQGNVKDTSWEVLRTLDAGSWFDSKFKDETIPDLQETLPWLATNNMAANVEIKAGPWPAHNIKIAEVAAPIIAPFLSKIPMVLSSFSWPALERLRQLLPQAALGMLVDLDHPKQLSTQAATIQAAYQQLGCVSLHLNNRACTADTIALCRRFASQIAVFTVNQRQRVATLMQWGVASVFSDAADLLNPNPGIERS